MRMRESRRWNLIDKLLMYLQYPFVINALIVSILIALSSSLFGATLVLKRFSLAGTALSHVAFAAMSIATVLGLLNKMVLVLPVTLIVGAFLLRPHNGQISGDAVIGMVSVGSLAIGYLVMNVFAVSGNVSGDVCTTLFGSTSILTLSAHEVLLCVALSVLAVFAFVVFYNKIFTITFDEGFAKASGMKTGFIGFTVSAIISIIVVVSMELVGSLLVSAFIIFPALSAMRLCGSFKGVVALSAVISMMCSFLGVLVAILAGTPVGATIVVSDIIIFVICCLLRIVFRRKIL